MLPTRKHTLERAITSLPSFLLPAFHTNITVRSFSSTRPCPSQIGRAPLSIPPEVKFVVKPAGSVGKGELAVVNIEGPLGQLSMKIPQGVNLVHDEEARKAYVTVDDRSIASQRAMWGTTRAYLSNHLHGVSEGHTAILRLIGVGYRATIDPSTSALTHTPSYPTQHFVNLKLGFSHPIELPIPLGMKASTPQPTRILLEGCEKEVVMQFAAKIRKWRVPEPYKGKGIFVNGETIRLKAKKIK